MTEAAASFANAKYLNLETFRRNGVAVRTPVWFAQEPGRQVFYVYSEADSGKVKRVRNHANVRIAPCSIRGSLQGDWVNAQARICAAEEARHGQDLLRAKYRWQKKLGDFFGRLLGHQHAVLAIELS